MPSRSSMVSTRNSVVRNSAGSDGQLEALRDEHANRTTVDEPTQQMKAEIAYRKVLGSEPSRDSRDLRLEIRQDWQRVFREAQRLQIAGRMTVLSVDQDEWNKGAKQ